VKRPRPSFGRNGRKVAYGFYLTIALFVGIGICLLGVSKLQAYVLDSVRAYVAGEGLWSKGQKEAVYRLSRYAASHDATDYQAFLQAIDVTLGDRQARLALDQPQPDLAKARDGFLHGLNHPSDVDRMIRFFLLFRDFSYMARAIDVWAEGDKHIQELQALGEILHDRIQAGADGEQVAPIVARMDRLNGELTLLENRFSATLGDAARWVRAVTRNAVYLSLLLLLGGGVLLALRILRDIRSVEQVQRLAMTAFHSSTEGIMVTDREGRIEAVNPAFTQITGYEAEEVIGRKPDVLSSGHQSDSFYEEMWQQVNHSDRWRGEVWNRRKNGEVYPEWLSIGAIRNRYDEVVQYVGLFSDITDRKHRENVIWHQAHYDILTDLPNRALFRDRLTQHLRLARREKTELALLFIDLDRFKEINDKLGHRAGDLLLQEVARRLRGCVRESDTVARLSGDEFTVILPGIQAVDDVERIAGKIVGECSRPYHVRGEEVTVSVSIGIAQHPQHADSVEALMHRADLAMYAAKQSGGNTFRRYFSELAAGEQGGFDAEPRSD